jgi:guanosine-3',5'-bis(diphosphate) 3'-pyrophosphohydrolase
MEEAGPILAALEFAAEKHRHQRRKDRHESPYINHPIQVASLLWEVGNVRDPVTLIAGILHDTIEDTGTTGEEIERRFGAEVRSVVEEVTDDRSLPKQTRKDLQVEHAAQKSARARAVKLADKIDNLRDLIESPPADWSLERKQDYARWARRVVDEMRGTNPGLEARFDDLYARGITALGLLPEGAA